jgi:hypothetical protein
MFGIKLFEKRIRQRLHASSTSVIGLEMLLMQHRKLIFRQQRQFSFVHSCVKIYSPALTSSTAMSSAPNLFKALQM